MVLKRPQKPGSGGEPESDDKANVELMEHLVQKSLKVNPSLRGGARNTGAVISDLKEQAISRSKGASSKPEGGAAGLSGNRGGLAERRKSTIAFFFEQKLGEYDEIDGDIQAREKALDAERQQLQAQVVGEIVDFLALMGGGGDSDEAREVLRDFKSFLEILGVTEADVIKAASQRR